MATKTEPATPLLHGFPWGIQPNGEFCCALCLAWCEMNAPHMIDWDAT